MAEIGKALNSFGLRLGMDPVDIDFLELVDGVERSVGRNIDRRRSDVQSNWVEDLELSTRAYKCVKLAGIRTIQELEEMSDGDLLKIKNLGLNTLSEIREATKSVGLPTRTGRSRAKSISLQSKIASDAAHLFIPQNARGLAIKDLPISARLENVLHKMNCRLLGDLNGCSLKQILRTKNCGRRTVSELKALVLKLQAGEFDLMPEAKGFEPSQVISFVDDLVFGMPVRERGIVLMRFGGSDNEPGKLHEIGTRYDITRERVRQILKRVSRQIHKALTMRFGNYLHDLATECLSEMRPFTPELLSQLLETNGSNFRFSIQFYIRLFHELAPEIPAWPASQKTALHPERSNQIANALREVLSGGVSSKPLSEVFALLKASHKVPRLKPEEFLESLQRNNSLSLDFSQPQRPSIKLSTPRTRDWVHHVLAQVERPLTPEEIIERARTLLGDNFTAPSPFGLANKLKPKDGFYLLDRRAFGLREHFRLPAPMWSRVRSDFHRLLKTESRPISTSEVSNERTFDWVSLTNAYEIAQVLREDARFTDLGRFLFALTEWGIEEREYVNDLIPRVLANAGHPMSAGAISDELQRFRSITPTSMASVLRNNSEVRDYGFGYYGLVSWGETSKTFLVSEHRLVNRIIGRSEPPFSFGQLCSILKISVDDPLIDRLWRTVRSLPKVRCEPNEKGIDTVLSHESWSLERALSSVLAQANKALPPYEIQWELSDRFGPAFRTKSLADVERALDRGLLFVRNTTGEYLLDHQLEDHLPDYANFRDVCFDILSNCNQIVGCEDLLERIRAEGIDVKNVSTSMLASILRGDESFEEVGSQRFRARR